MVTEYSCNLFWVPKRLLTLKDILNVGMGALRGFIKPFFKSYMAFIKISLSDSLNPTGDGG